jgi:hypothetical protein
MIGIYVLVFTIYYHSIHSIVMTIVDVDPETPFQS